MDDNITAPSFRQVEFYFYISWSGRHLKKFRLLCAYIDCRHLYNSLIQACSLCDYEMKFDFKPKTNLAAFCFRTQEEQWLMI